MHARRLLQLHASAPHLQVRRLMCLSGFLGPTSAPEKKPALMSDTATVCVRYLCILTWQSCARLIYCQVGLMIWQLRTRLLYCHRKQKSVTGRG